MWAAAYRAPRTATWTAAGLAARLALTAAVLAGSFVGLEGGLFEVDANIPGSPEEQEAGAHSLNSFNTANSSFSCDLCARKFIFVIGTGRSGSTTVMQMVNELPGHFISGENLGQMLVWRDLYRAQQVQDRRFACMVQDWVFRHSRDPADIIEPGDMTHRTSARALVAYEKQVAPVRGFKEIRYTSLGMLRWLKEVFPCSKMVMNIRQPEALFKSREKSFGNADHGWAQSVTKNLTDFHAERRPYNDTFLLPLEEFSVYKFNAMAAWIGVEHCRFVSVARNKGQGSKNKFRNPRHIRCWDKKWDREVSAYFARVEEMKAAKADRAAAKNAKNNMGENKDIRREVTRPPMG